MCIFIFLSLLALRTDAVSQKCCTGEIKRLYKSSMHGFKWCLNWNWNWNIQVTVTFRVALWTFRRELYMLNGHCDVNVRPTISTQWHTISKFNKLRNWDRTFWLQEKILYELTQILPRKLASLITLSIYLWLRCKTCRCYGHINYKICWDEIKYF